MPVKTDRFIGALSFTVKWEGGYVNNPADPGGATNHGITQRVYDAYRKKNELPLQPVLEIASKEYMDIYHANYWLVGDCDQLPPLVDAAHFDTCVNLGPFHAAKLLQEALSVNIDGVLGPQTLSAANNADAKKTAAKICDERIAFRHERVAENPTQQVFLQGWLNRDYDLKKFCSS